MKKAALMVLMLAMGASIASAATVKSTTTDMGNFLGREAKRAGWSDSTSSWGNFWTNINPVVFLKNQQDAYNARKTPAKK